ncbi:helix-turn-helix transcriptional regulator [Paenibacillus sinopodophylli]|uniref:helix-turn-helix transcriptional regulator n=1 Tax=Paenibacillus sinopodophylli TaxID=1837342 RepID=UPI001485FFCC|nr:helix-turn-helix domain-containing protein [Paenibacillus sinopodophylli]
MKNTLNLLLESKGINKSDFAREIGVTRQTVIRISNGSPPSLEIGLKIANYFQKDVRDIFFISSVKQSARKTKKELA